MMTVMPPKMWDSVEGGGYWTKELPSLDLVKQKNKLGFQIWVVSTKKS